MLTYQPVFINQAPHDPDRDRPPGVAPSTCHGTKSAMGWLLAIGCYAAIFSPAAVLLLTVVGRSHTLVVLMLGAAFVWLLSISLVAALWAALAHLKAHTWLLVLYAVPAQATGELRTCGRDV